MHETRPAAAGEGAAPAAGTPQEGCVLAAHIESALIGPLTGEALDAVTAMIWRAWGAGELSEAQAERLDGLARARRARMAQRGRGGAHGGPARPVLRRPARPRGPDRAASIARRRRHAASGAVPPAIAAEFTQGQVAVLAVVGRQAARSACTWPMDRIAALAGVCRTVAREALRLAQALGLLRVRERRHRGARSETNVVQITQTAWRRWLRRGPKSERSAPQPAGGGCGKTKATSTEELREGSGRPPAAEVAVRWGQEAIRTGRRRQTAPSNAVRGARK